MESIVVGTRWNALVRLEETYQDKDAAGLTPERVLEEIAEALLVEGPLQGRLCLDLNVEGVKRGSRIPASSQVSVTGIVRAVRVEPGDHGLGEVIRVGVAVRAGPDVKVSLLTGTLDMHCCESIQGGVGHEDWD